jgi:hypothetical protein
MTSLAEYFASNRPVAKWHAGDRVFGKIDEIPFIGTCGGETMVNETIGSMVTVFVDLPVKHKDTWHTTFIKVKPSKLKRLMLLSDKDLSL